MSSPLHIRPARRDEINTLCQLSREAFRGRPMTEALVPQRLLQLHGTSEADALDFRAQRHRKAFDDANKHYVVVADAATDEPAGWAVWHSYPPDAVAPVLKTPEERAALPPYVDREALAVVEREGVLLDQTIRDALGEEGYENSWYLDPIAVNPAYQRRGIGRMLMNWGQERADKEHRNVRFMASETGAKLYRACGYEEVGSRDILGGTEYAFIKRAQ